MQTQISPSPKISSANHALIRQRQNKKKNAASAWKNGITYSQEYSFNLIDHNIQHLNIIAIDHLPHSDTISRLNKETFWIHTLKTTEPQGLNMNEQSSFPIHLRQTF
ncbi:hypothetical protein PoB_004496000 [Plakobranchus ocellatus]|uniref:Uncharacterized protein n=1 Tax=Plakobranchus ocellatus TaxID=259542 RepID=A0AAV4BFZ7_9GAST|nr:hypothetical protein PoB_004496000 [Plakobranchus ocellatus]